MADSPGEHALVTAGSGTAPSSARRRGDVVLKEAGPWSGAVLGLLRHLESVGFGGAPRVVGNGYAPDGRMTVTFMPGVSAHPGPWPEDVMERIGGLLRSVHEATASYVPPPDAVWRETWLRTVGDGIRVFGHGDAAPWNLVGPGPGPSALIDWDFAGPIDPLTDLAYAVWLNAQLHDDDVAERHGLPDAVTRARHAHRIMDGYGLPADGRADLVDRMIDVAVQSARAEAILGGVTPDSTEAVSAEGYPTLWAIAWRARSASWMLRHRRVLCRPA